MTSLYRKAVSAGKTALFFGVAGPFLGALPAAILAIFAGGAVATLWKENMVLSMVGFVYTAALRTAFVYALTAGIGYAIWVEVRNRAQNASPLMRLTIGATCGFLAWELEGLIETRHWGTYPLWENLAAGWPGLVGGALCGLCVRGSLYRFLFSDLVADPKARGALGSSPEGSEAK